MFLNRARLLAEPKVLGQWGEKRSEKLLKNKGLRRLARRFSCKTGEIDLVMMDTDGTIVFVEVKTRANEDFTPAELVVTNTKRKKLISASRYFIETYNVHDRPFRFDVVTVVLGKTKREQIKHYSSAFVP